TNPTAIRLHKLNQRSTFQFTINDIQYNIPIQNASKIERILGIYITGASIVKPTIVKCKQSVNNITRAIWAKRLSHDQVAYIINAVAIPRLEYISSACILHPYQINNIFNPLKKIFKQKFNFALNTPNSIVFSKLSNTIFDFQNLHLRSHATAFRACMNNPVT